MQVGTHVELNDVWILTNADGTGGTPVWGQLSPGGPAPSPRGHTSAAYDQANNRLIVYGGDPNVGNCFGCVNDTWVLTNADGTGGVPQWSQLSTNTPPPLRQDPKVAYDPAGNRLIVYGGNENACVNPRNEVWVLSNANGMGGAAVWTQLATTGIPPVAFSLHSTVFDVATNRLISSSGYGAGHCQNGTWVLENANGTGGPAAWSQLMPAGGLPPVRSMHGAVYDQALNQMIIFGGGYCTPVRNDAWLLKGANGLDGVPEWIDLAPSGTPPLARVKCPAVFNPNTRRMILFGGHLDGSSYVNDTWCLAPRANTTTSPASAVTAYSATLNGSVNPNNFASDAWFEFSTDPSFQDAQQTSSQNVGNGGLAVPVSGDIASLKADTTYYFRLATDDGFGVRYGDVQTFQTSYPLASDAWFDDSSGLAGGGAIYRPVPGVINERGRICFKAFGSIGSGAVTSGNDSLLMTDASGSLKVVARENAFVDASARIVGLFNDIILTDAGQSLMRDKISNASLTSDQGYFISPDGTNLELISREGDGAPDGGTFILHTGKPAIDDNERVYFSGDLSGVTSKKNTGVWFDDAGMLTTLVSEGDDISGVMGGENAWLGNILGMVAAGGDGVSFIAALQNNPDNAEQKTNTAKNSAVFASSGGSLSVVARKGDSAPGAGSSIFKAFSGVARSGNGDHAFIAQMAATGGVSTANDQVLVASISGVQHLVAREGSTTITSGLKPRSFGDFHVSNTGQIIFLVTLEGATTSTDGVLCRWTAGGGIEMLAREGASAAGTGANFGVLSTFSASRGGAIALATKLSNGKPALMRALAGGPLALVTQKGDIVVVNGAPRAILSLAIYSNGCGNGGGGGGMGAAINDLGQVFTVLSLGSGDYVARIYE